MAENLVEKQASLWTGIVGIFLLICGIGSVGTGFALVNYGFTGGHGLWSGPFLIVPGILGVLVWGKRSKGVMIGFLTMCIIATIVSTIQAIITGTAYSRYSRIHCPYSYYSRYWKLCHIWKRYMDCLLSITIFNSIGAILALAGSILGCVSVCSQEPPSTVIVQQPAAIVNVATTHPGPYVGPMGYPQQMQHPAGYPQQMQKPMEYPQQLGGFQQQPPPYATARAQTGPPPQY